MEKRQEWYSQAILHGGGVVRNTDFGPKKKLHSTVGWVQARLCDAMPPTGVTIQVGPTATPRLENAVCMSLNRTGQSLACSEDKRETGAYEAPVAELLADAPPRRSRILVHGRGLHLQCGGGHIANKRSEILNVKKNCLGNSNWATGLRRSTSKEKYNTQASRPN